MIQLGGKAEPRKTFSPGMDPVEQTLNMGESVPFVGSLRSFAELVTWLKQSGPPRTGDGT